MANKTTWRHIGIMRAWKIVCFILFLITLLGTLFNLYFYFSSPSGITNTYALYSAVLSGIATLFMYCCYQYTKGKLNEAETNGRKTSPAVMSELISFSKRHDELLERIDSAQTLEALEALGVEVDRYNRDAEAFAEANGVTPKIITVSEYDIKKSKFSK